MTRRNHILCVMFVNRSRYLNSITIRKGFPTDVIIYSLELHDVTQRFVYMKTREQLTDSMPINLRSCPSLHIGNYYLSCIFHMNQNAAACVKQSEVHQGSSIFFVYNKQIHG